MYKCVKSQLTEIGYRKVIQLVFNEQCWLLNIYVKVRLTGQRDPKQICWYMLCRILRLRCILNTIILYFKEKRTPLTGKPIRNMKAYFPPSLKPKDCYFMNGIKMSQYSTALNSTSHYCDGNHHRGPAMNIVSWSLKREM